MNRVGARPAQGRAAIAGLVAALLAAAVAPPLQAQAVRGRVVDAQSGEGVADVEIVLRRGRAVVDRAVTDSLGLFHVLGRTEGNYRVEASHIAYERAATALRVGAEELVVIDLRVSRGVVQLDPLTITARARDPRHDASYEGLYARRSDFPRVGGRRAVLHTDLEMRASRVSDVLGRMNPRFRRRSYVSIGEGFEDERRGCSVVYWNGRMIGTRLLAEILIESTSAGELEGLEYYDGSIYAPEVFRDEPSYAWGYRCNVVALWSRRGA
jgi:hypothetical protein